MSSTAAALPDEHEFAFTNADFECARKLIHEHAGISLADSKRQLVYSRVGRRLRALGLDSFEAYFAALDGNPQEWEAFTNALTTNLTSFFREEHHFHELARGLLPEQGPLWATNSFVGSADAKITASVFANVLAAMLAAQDDTVLHEER